MSDVPSLPDPDFPWDPDFPPMPGLPPWPRPHIGVTFPPLRIPDLLKPRVGPELFPLPPREPSLRDEERRRADPLSGDPDYFDVIRLAETTAAFETEWNDALAEFEWNYGGLIGLSVEPPAEPRALPPSLLIGKLDNPDLLQLVLPEFVFTEKPSDALLEPRKLDMLMSEMVAMADRCASNRQVQRELAARGAAIALELIDFLKRDRIYRAQLADGLLSTPYVEAARALDVGLLAEAAASARAAHQTKLRENQYGDAALDVVSDAAQRSAWAAGLNSYTSPPPGDAAKHAWGGEPAKTVSDHLRFAAREMAARAADIELQEIKIEETVSANLKKQAAHQNVALRERAHLAAVSVRDEIARHRANVDIVKAKLRIACAPGGALNYAEQERQVRKRLERDFRGLAARIPVLAVGLRTVLGIDLPLPATLHNQLPEKLRRRVGEPVGSLKGDVLEDALTWTGMAVEILLAQRHQDERLSVTLSLAQLLGVVNWGRFKQGKTVAFKLSGAEFAGRRQLRLAVIGATSVGSLSGRAVQVRLRLPDQDATEDAAGVREIDPVSAAPIILLSGVLSAAEGQPEQAVSDPVLNRAPLGEWSITLDPPTQVAGLDDIRLTFIVIGAAT